MIPISYDNVMNGLNKGIHMRLLCPTRQVAQKVFRRAYDLWHIDGYTITRKLNLEIKVGPSDNDRVVIQIKNFEAVHNDSWRGFRGVYMLHPNINPETLMPRFQQMVKEMDWHNERHLEKWRA